MWVAEKIWEGGDCWVHPVPSPTHLTMFISSLVHSFIHSIVLHCPDYRQWGTEKRMR